MAGIMATRGPRTYAGDKVAPLDEFFLSMAHSLARGDRSKQDSITRTCERIQKELCVRNVFDIGSLMRFPRQKMLDLLGSFDKDLEHWVDSLEDVLEFEFRTLTAVETFRAHVPGAPRRRTLNGGTLEPRRRHCCRRKEFFSCFTELLQSPSLLDAAVITRHGGVE